MFSHSSSTTGSHHSPKSNEIDPSKKNRIIQIALTRELGNNDKLRRAIEKHPTLESMSQNTLAQVQLQILEIPCIEHTTAKDFGALQDIMKDPNQLDHFDYILITSPESAHVLIQAMQQTTHHPEEISISPPIEPQSRLGHIHIAAVGKATEKELLKYGLSVHFVPSQANGETLAKELPPRSKSHPNRRDGNATSSCTRVLYPASAKAADTIQSYLQTQRTDASFHVTRLNTYDTVGATIDSNIIKTFLSNTPNIHSFKDDHEHENDSRYLHIACFGSPSSVEAWLHNVDTARTLLSKSTTYPNNKNDNTNNSNGNVLAVCIGGTTATACMQSQRWKSDHIFYPKTNPGIEGWADSCILAIQSLLK